MAQGGFEPPASLLLEEGGLPVAYRASRPPCCQRSIRQSVRRELNPPVRFGRPSPGPLGHGHVSLSGRRGSRTLKACRSSGFRPGAVASRLALPFAVWMAGFEPAWSGIRGRRMKPGSPTSRWWFSSAPRRTKKARGRVTPGLLGVRPQRFGVIVAEGRRSASSAGYRPGPLPASAYHRSSRDCVPSCPVRWEPGLCRRVLGIFVADTW